MHPNQFKKTKNNKTPSAISTIIPYFIPEILENKFCHAW